MVKELTWDESNELVGRMRKVRLQNRLTYNQFAKLIGVTGSTVWNWENGKSKIRKEYIECIENAMQPK